MPLLWDLVKTWLVNTLLKGRHNMLPIIKQISNEMLKNEKYSQAIVDSIDHI